MIHARLLGTRHQDQRFQMKKKGILAGDHDSCPGVTLSDAKLNECGQSGADAECDKIWAMGISWVAQTKKAA
jgi:hypothetical protein